MSFRDRLRRARRAVENTVTYPFELSVRRNMRAFIDGFEQRDLVAARERWQGVPVVVLGSAMMRAYAANRLNFELRARTCIVSGAGDGFDGFMQEHARDWTNVIIDDRPVSTRGNAFFTRAILDQNRLGRHVILVTDLEHMYRSRMLFQAQGVTVTPFAVIRDDKDREDYIRSEARSYVRNRVSIARGSWN